MNNYYRLVVSVEIDRKPIPSEREEFGNGRISGEVGKHCDRKCLLDK